MTDIVAALRAAAEVENESYLATIGTYFVPEDAGETVNHFHWRRRNTLHDAADIMREAADSYPKAIDGDDRPAA